MLIVYLESMFKKYYIVIIFFLLPNKVLSCIFINLVIFSYVFDKKMLLDKFIKKVLPKILFLFTFLVTCPKIIPKSSISASRQNICIYFEIKIW